MVMKHSVVVGGRHTSISLEEAFWVSLKRIADGAATPGIEESKKKISGLVTSIDERRKPGENLSSAIRLHVLAHYQKLAAGVS